MYNVTLHPLRRFPGPFWWALSPVPRTYHLVRGDLVYRTAALHARYGAAVRLAPNELAFSDPQAWKDIYGHRAAGEPEFPKAAAFYRPVRSLATNIITAGRDEHSALRRQLAHGFSDRSMRGQEPIIGGYVDLLMRRLRENARGGAVALNMREWLNWATFDIIGDLGFGSPFGCLETSDYHPWVRLITDSIKTSAFLQALVSLGARPLVELLSRCGVLRARDEHQKLVREKLLQRMELGAGRPDLIEGLLRKKAELGLPLPKLAMNASLLIIAGSETTATLLSGAVYLLAAHPAAQRRAAAEVRAAFADEAAITLHSVGGLDYLLACLNETLRRYPPVAGMLPRTAPAGGGRVAGRFVPAGTVVGVWQWAISHDAALWHDPAGFHPERFLAGDAVPPAFRADRLDAMQPFSLGPRNCIGRNLAYAEMRLILARILWAFDLRLADDSRDWLRDQKVYTLWDKPALNVYLTPVDREGTKEES